MPVVAREVKNKTIQLLENNEFAMFNANSAINPLEYDGIDHQIRSKQSNAMYKATAFVGFNSSPTADSVVQDLRGASPDEDVFEDACLTNVNNFGMAMDCYLSTTIHSRFSKTMYAKERTTPGTASAAGYLVPEFKGTLNFKFHGNLFNLPRQIPLTSAVSASSAPTYTLSAAGSGSSFAAADAGTYSYKISAVYKDGETLAGSQGTQAVTAGQLVSATLTYSGSPLWFNVFRAPVGTTTGHLFIGRCAPPTNGSGNAVQIDDNSLLPGLGSAYLLMHDPDCLVFRQLGSMIKYDLAVIDTSYRWLQLMYGTPVIPAIRKHVIISNIGLA